MSDSNTDFTNSNGPDDNGHHNEPLSPMSSGSNTSNVNHAGHPFMPGAGQDPMAPVDEAVDPLGQNPPPQQPGQFTQPSTPYQGRGPAVPHQYHAGLQNGQSQLGEQPPYSGQPQYGGQNGGNAQQHNAPYAQNNQGQVPAPLPEGIPQYGGIYGNQAFPAVPPMNKPYYGCPPVDAVKRFFLKYATFKGRASRSEYWWSVLFVTIIGLILGILNNLTSNHMGFLNDIWTLAILVPTLAVAVRRLHDTNRSGWWIFLPDVFMAVGIILIIISAAGIVFQSPLLLQQQVGSDYSGLAGLGALIIVGLLLFLIGLILTVVLMVVSSNPAGARFDDDAANMGMSQPRDTTPPSGYPNYNGYPQQGNYQQNGGNSQGGYPPVSANPYNQPPQA